MRLWPFLKLAIPLGTLAALALAYGIGRLTKEPEAEINIKRPPPATFAKLEAPAHGRKLVGKVVNPAGEPLEGALVWVRSSNEPSFSYSDSQGAFRFDDLGPGPWPAIVVALGFEPLELTLQESASPQVAALRVAYGPPPKLAAIDHQALQGRIGVPEGFDASHFEVVLVPEAPTRIDSALPRRVECDAQGAFKIDDLIVAHYQLLVLPAWARGGSWPDLLAGVGDGDKHEFTHAKGAGDLILRLQFGMIEGVLLEQGGQPVEGAVVELTLAGEPGRVWIPESTDAAGKFALRPLPAGKYELKLHAGETTLAREIELHAGEQHKLEPLRLPAPPAH